MKAILTLVTISISSVALFSAPAPEMTPAPAPEIADDCVLVKGIATTGEPSNNYSVSCEEGENQWNCPDEWTVTEGHTECGTIPYTHECTLTGNRYDIKVCTGICAPHWDPDPEKRCAWDSNDCDDPIASPRSAEQGSTSGC